MHPYDLAAVPLQLQHTVIGRRRREQRPVDDPEGVRRLIRAEIYVYGLIVGLDLLELGIRASGGVHYTVAAEAVVRGPLAVVSAVGHILRAVSVALPKGLIREIPYEAPLVAGLALGEICVLEHAPAGVSHGMRILTAYERLIIMLHEEPLYIPDLGVHLALHIAGVGVAPVVEQALIVHQAVPVQSPEALRHGERHRSSEGLIAYGPDEYGRVVLTQLEGGVHAVQHHTQTVLPIPGHRVGYLQHASGDGFPGAVRLQIVLGYHIEPVPVTEVVDVRGILIV